MPLIPKLFRTCTTRKGVFLIDFTPTDSSVLAFSEGKEGKVGDREREGKEERTEGGREGNIY